MSAGPPSDPLRLGRLIDSSRRRQGLGWAEFARRAGLSRTTLNDIRKGKIDNLQPLTKTGIEQAALWSEDDVDRVIAGDDPRPRNSREEAPPAAPAKPASDLANPSFDEALEAYQVALRRLRRAAAVEPGLPPEIADIVESWNNFLQALLYGGPPGVRKAVGVVAQSYERGQLGDQRGTRAG